MPVATLKKEAKRLPSLLEVAGVVPKEETEAVKQEDDVVAKRPAASASGRAPQDSSARKRPSASSAGVTKLSCALNTSGSGVMKSSVAKHARATPSAAGRGRKRTNASGSGEASSSVAQPALARSSSSTGAGASGKVWWTCPKCDFSISALVPVLKRNLMKSYHVKNKHGKSKIAKRGNYLSRSRMLRAIWNGTLEKTGAGSQGLRKEDLMLNKLGRVVPTRRSQHSSKVCARNGWADNWRQWCRANAAVRKEQGITGFTTLKKKKSGGGAPTLGQERSGMLYMKVLERWANTKAASITKSLEAAGSNQKVAMSPRSSNLPKA